MELLRRVLTKCNERLADRTLDCRPHPSPRSSIILASVGSRLLEEGSMSFAVHLAGASRGRYARPARVARALLGRARTRRSRRGDRRRDRLLRRWGCSCMAAAVRGPRRWRQRRRDRSRREAALRCASGSPSTRWSTSRAVASARPRRGSEARCGSSRSSRSEFESCRSNACGPPAPARSSGWFVYGRSSSRRRAPTGGCPHIRRPISHALIELCREIFDYEPFSPRRSDRHRYYTARAICLWRVAAGTAEADSAPATGAAAARDHQPARLRPPAMIFRRLARDGRGTPVGEAW